MLSRTNLVLLLATALAGLGLSSCSSTSDPPVTKKDASPKDGAGAKEVGGSDTLAPDAGGRDATPDAAVAPPIDAPSPDVAVDTSKKDAPAPEDTAAAEAAIVDTSPALEAGPSLEAGPDLAVDANWALCSDKESAGRLAVYYYSESAASTSSIKLHLDVQNPTALGTRQSKVTVRYWFTDPDPSTPNVAERVTNKGMDGGAAAKPSGPPANTKFIPLDPPRQGANTVLEISFPYDVDAGAGELTETGAMVFNIHKDVTGDASAAAFDQTQSYSYDSKLTTKLGLNPKITAYISGNLAWGCEP